MKFWAGFCYGLAIGLPAAWYANSQYGFGGSNSILVIVFAIFLATTATGLRMRADKQA